MVKHELIETWTESELAAETAHTFLTWAEAVNIVGQTVTRELEQHDANGDEYNAELLRDAWSIILTGAAK